MHEPNQRLPKPMRIARTHARLLLAAVIGLAVLAALTWFTHGTRLSTRLLIGWDVGAVVYLALAFMIIAKFDLRRVRQRAASQDEGGFLVLILTVAAAVSSIAAIVVELAWVRDTKDPNAAIYLALAVITIALSWTLVHVVLALLYAHEYYGEDHRGRGLLFPGEGEHAKPDYWDFVYFSFVIGLTFQVSDVQVTNRYIRRIVVAHGAVSFVFNVAIVSLMVNIASQFI
jgi:uncharacterized membrane protein